MGDAVFGHPSTWFGAHAEYICTKATAPMGSMPTGMSYEEAGAVCDGVAQALSALRLADARVGRRLVIYGASGSLGTAAVQLAKHFGAHVTAVCGAAHVDLVRSLGADAVIDYRQEDYTKRGQTYDAIIDAVDKDSFRHGRRALDPGGVYVATDGGRFFLETFAWVFVTRFFGSRRVRRGSSAKQARHPVPEGSHRGRRVSGSRRSSLPDGPGGRGAPLRRDVAQGGQRRPDDRVVRRRHPADWRILRP